MAPSLRIASCAPGSRTELLIADDHPIVLAGLRTILLALADVTLIGEGTTYDAVLSLTETFRPDLLLLDSTLDSRSTLSLIQWLRDTHACTRALIFAEQPDDDLLRAFVCAGAWGWILKAEPPTRIVQALTSVAQGQRWFSSSLLAAVLMGKAQPTQIPLTKREREVVMHLVQGGTNATIAQQVGISERTVAFHLTNIFTKLNLRTRGEVMAWATRVGFGTRSATATHLLHGAVSVPESNLYDLTG